ncbi:hypothetical protein F220043C3_16890 [Enterocloster asparagiformis]|uniref:hypothetical protein n=1 Tax=Enterocloster asparagiformis TaxID=333367 RepID=UPI0034BDF3F2
MERRGEKGILSTVIGQAGNRLPRICLPGNFSDQPSGFKMQTPSGDFSFDTDGTENSPSERTGWIWIAASVAVLAIGLVVAKTYKH